MPRSRMVRPDFWDDEKLSTISRDARLTFIALWVFADDFSVVKAHPVWLKNHIYPYDEKLKLSDFKSWIQEIQDIGAIIPFSAKNELYFFITNFDKHQTINRPSALRNPEPPANILEHSMSTHDPLIDKVKYKLNISKEEKDSSAQK